MLKKLFHNYTTQDFRSSNDNKKTKKNLKWCVYKHNFHLCGAEPAPCRCFLKTRTCMKSHYYVVSLAEGGIYFI